MPPKPLDFQAGSGSPGCSRAGLRMIPSQGAEPVGQQSSPDFRRRLCSTRSEAASRRCPPLQPHAPFLMEVPEDRSFLSSVPRLSVFESPPGGLKGREGDVLKGASRKRELLHLAEDPLSSGHACLLLWPRGRSGVQASASVRLGLDTKHGPPPRERRPGPRSSARFSSCTSRCSRRARWRTRARACRRAARPRSSSRG